MHIELTFKEVPETKRELIIACLLDAEGFEEMDNGDLKVIFTKEQFAQETIADIATKYELLYETKEIAPQNWNTIWESNFEPVIVNNFVGIRASFHPPIKNVQHEIVITPKMSFGTGHHATTFLMIEQMQKLNFTEKSVFDFGTGTGILAILAKKLGAKTIVANDIDEWSITNAKENFQTNNASAIQLFHTDSGKIDHNFDIILANINRNVLIDNIPTLSSQLVKNGILLLSGILEEDIDAIKSIAAQSHLEEINKTQKNKWVCLTFRNT